MKQSDIFHKNLQHIYPSLCVCDHGWASFIDSEEERCISPVKISKNDVGIECVYTNVESRHQRRTDVVQEDCK